MKRLFGTAALLFVLASSANAQTMLGLSLGPTFNNLELKNSTVKPDGMVSYGVGLTMMFGKGPIKLQAQGVYLTKGAVFPATEAGATDTIDVTQKLNFLEFVPAVRFEVHNGPYLYAGPMVALEGQCLARAKVGSLTIEETCNSANVYLPFRHKLDYGAVGAVGFSHNFGKRFVFLEGRYSLGLRNVNGDDADVVEARTRTMSIMIGFATKPK